MAGTTLSGGYTTLVSLTDPAANPVLVTGSLSDALYGSAPTAWTITNAGTIESGTRLCRWRLRACSSCRRSRAPVVDAAWRRLLERSGPRPGIPLTDDPDLCLLVDGRRIDPMRIAGSSRVFRLSGPVDSVRIMSRAASPQEIGLARNSRLLGVAVRRVVAVCGNGLRSIEASDEALSAGCHDFEPNIGLRWTNGNALLPQHLFTGWSGSSDLTLDVGGTGQYLDEGEEYLAA